MVREGSFRGDDFYIHQSQNAYVITDMDRKPLSPTASRLHWIQVVSIKHKDKNGGMRMKMMKRKKKKKKKKSWKEQEQPLYLLTCWLHPVHPIPVFS
jgi:hypothetical protein